MGLFQFMWPYLYQLPKMRRQITTQVTMIMKLFLLQTIMVVMVVAQEMSGENTTSVQEKPVYVGFWDTLAEIALSEDSFKSWLINKFEWVVFLLVETLFKLYF